MSNIDNRRDIWKFISDFFTEIKVWFYQATPKCRPGLTIAVSIEFVPLNLSSISIDWLGIWYLPQPGVIWVDSGHWFHCTPDDLVSGALRDTCSPSWTQPVNPRPTSKALPRDRSRSQTYLLWVLLEISTRCLSWLPCSIRRVMTPCRNWQSTVYHWLRVNPCRLSPRVTEPSCPVEFCPQWNSSSPWGFRDKLIQSPCCPIWYNSSPGEHVRKLRLKDIWLVRTMVVFTVMEEFCLLSRYASVFSNETVSRLSMSVCPREGSTVSSHTPATLQAQNLK